MARKGHYLSATYPPSWPEACCDAIVQAPAPSRPIERGIAGFGLLVSKFADHIPLYRQSVIYAREGVELERSSLASWVGASNVLLRSLVNSKSSGRAGDTSAFTHRSLVVAIDERG